MELLQRGKSTDRDGRGGGTLPSSFALELASRDYGGMALLSSYGFHTHRTQSECVSQPSAIFPSHERLPGSRPCKRTASVAQFQLERLWHGTLLVRPIGYVAEPKQVHQRRIIE